MKKNTYLLAAGIVSIVSALIAWDLNFNQLTYQIGNGQLLIYPSAGLVLLGLVLIYRANRNSFYSDKI
jgi:hypothetical protein